MKLGATGEYPLGKLNEDDEGEIAIAIVSVKATGKVLIDFGKPVVWLAMNANQAKGLGELLIKHAGDLDDGNN